MNRRPICLLSVFLLLLVVQARADESVRRFVVYNASNGLADNSAQSIVCTKTGRMVVTTIGHINFYDGMSFFHVNPRLETKYPLPNYSGHYHPYFDRYHHLWLKDKHSVTCVNLTVEQFVVNIDSVFASYGVQGKLDDMFVDDDGCLWMLHADSIRSSEKHRAVPVLKGQKLQDLAEWDDKELLLFYGNGEVVGFDLLSMKQLYRVPAYSAAEARRYHRTSLVKRYNDTYLQLRDGQKESVLLQFDVKTRRWTTLLTLPYKMNNLKVHKDMLYIASENGYWTYDMLTGEKQHVEQLVLTDGRTLHTDVNTIEFDRQGGMWLGTERRGLLYAKPYTSPLHSYGWNTPEARRYRQLLEQQQPSPAEYKGEAVNCVLTDSRSWTWVGKRNGLWLYRLGQSEPQVFTVRDGMFNDVIHSVVESHDHDIWVSTSYGISCLDIEDGELKTINSYNHTDNVPNESFVNGRAMVLDDGTVIMQSLDHIVAFNPSHFRSPTAYRDFRFYPKLTRLMVNGTLVNYDTELDGLRILDRAITRTDHIDVDYRHNSLSLVFSGLNYFRPLQTYFRYRVPELDEQWRVLSYFNSNGLVDEHGLLHLALTALNPGTYHIEMQVSMYPDVWVQEPFVWTVNVSQPWWRTTGVYLTLALIAFVLLIVNVYWLLRNNKLRLRRNASEQEVLRQLRILIHRCDGLAGESFSPLRDAQFEGSTTSVHSEEFMGVMLRVIPYMKQYPEGSLSVSDICRACNLNYVGFLELFSKNIAKKSHELARRLRLQQGAVMLRQSDKLIEDIAEECGFSTPNYFVVCFRRMYKVSPLEYRQHPTPITQHPSPSTHKV